MKARRLSDKKIHISCETKIFFNGVDGEILLDTITTRFVYKKEATVYASRTYSDETPVVCYYANIKNGFVAGICNKYGIKKRHVLFPHRERPGKRFEVEVDGEKVLVVFNDILLIDKDWYTAWNRNRLLKSLLEV